MLTGLHIGNFKAFAEVQRIPIRPLTLIYGANSAGKSSLLHGLLLGAHAMKTGELDVHQPADAGDSVDLGGFHQYVHRGDLRRQVEWGVDLGDRSPRQAPTDAPDWFSNFSVKVDFRAFGKFRIVTPRGITTESVLGVDRISVTTGGELLLEMESAHVSNPISEAVETVPYGVPADRSYSLHSEVRSAPTMFWICGVNFGHPAVQGWLKYFWDRFSDAKLSPRNLQTIGKEWEDICDWPTSVTPLLPGGLDANWLKDYRRDGRAKLAGARGKKPVVEFAHHAMGHFFDLHFRGIRHAVIEHLERLMYFGPLRSYPQRRLLVPTLGRNIADGSAMWEIVSHDKKVCEEINRWLGDTTKLNTPFEIVVRSWLNGQEVERVASQVISHRRRHMGKDDPKLRTEALRDALLRLRARRENIHEVFLKDKRTGTRVSHRDLGVGVSQVLPVLVAAHATKKHIHAIEQPELHLHPALQAELADIFIESALGKRQNTFLLETHSEHLLLRMMRRMRETASGTLPKGSRPVKPEDVSVVYVQPDGPRSIVREMPLNERGELLKQWPGGFFEEGLREVLPSHAG